MQISGPGTPPQLQLRLPAQALQGVVLKDGATLQATVSQSEPSGKLTLEISGKLLQAISSLRLAAGTVLQLRVERSNDGVILHLDEPQRQRLMYQQALRHNLPRQESLRPLLQQLAQWHGSARPATQSQTTTSKPATAEIPTPTAATQPATPVTKPIAQAIARLLAILPTLESLMKADGLQQAIARSGLFLENHLLQGARPAQLGGDVKTALLRLAQTIRQQLGEVKPQQQSATATRETTQEGLQNLLRQIESGIARIQLHQLNALSGKPENEQRLNVTLELPFYQPGSNELDTLQIRIRRDGKNPQDKKSGAWSVTLQFSTEAYGEIHAVVTLSNGKITTTFWCAEEETVTLFREQLHQLQARLKKQGLKDVQCSSRHGTPAEERFGYTNQANGLIDTRA